MVGRNQKDNADYFSHDADASSDEKIIYIESKFGLKGYAIYFKLLECLTRSEGFKIPWNEIKKAVYAAKFNISVTEIEQIVSECCRDEIKAFVIEDGYLFSYGLIKRFSSLIAKREYNRQKYQEQKQQYINSVTENDISVNGNQQYSKEEKSKEENIYPIEIKKFTEKFIEWSEKEHGKKAPKKTPALLRNSCDAIYKLIGIDGFTLEYISNVLRWGAKDEFWSEQLRSLAGLRKKNGSGLTKFQNIAAKFEKSKTTLIKNGPPTGSINSNQYKKLTEAEIYG